jgi:hypothetical protein
MVVPLGTGWAERGDSRLLDVVVLSIVTIAMCALGVVATRWYDSRSLPKNPAPVKPMVEYLPTVACADDMFVRLGNLNFMQGNLTVVGGDGAYFALANGPRLAELVKKIAGQGAAVKYLLIAPTIDTEFAIEKLGLFSAPGVEFFVLGDTALESGNQEIARRFQTTHPTLFENSDGKGLWLERNHPRNSRHAYGVSYVPPGLLSGSLMSEHSKFEEEISALLSVSRRLKAPRSDRASKKLAA